MLAAPFRWMGGVSKRAITSLPWISGGTRQGSVSPQRALQLIPLYACVRILADSIASLPVQTYRKNGTSREILTFVPSLLFQPAARDNLFEWLHKCVVSMALRGNAYGLITQRDDFGFPTMIEWLNPDEMWVDELRPTQPRFYWQGVEVPREQIVHIPWVVMPGCVTGLSPVQYFARTIGVGLSATEYGLSWFDNGGTPPSTMKNTNKAINPDEAEEISDRLSARVRARKPLVYGSDWDFTALTVNPEESQFIQTMRLNASQIAAIYGVPPEKVGGDTGSSMTYSTVELNQIEFLTMTLRPWLTRLEAKLSALMPGKEFVKFNADAMLRVDLMTRYRAHQTALNDGWRNRDEIRALEDLPALPDGQGQVYLPVSMLGGPNDAPAPAPDDPNPIQ
ncbi:phage portal protein [Streptomyces lunaelactis]|uniref:phage portal protein n=1 Tax=Streptomyces lunaelactis TaxID=1535768 RepID=UPI0015846A84|nr:phage portal protein [Streptomyces lunaelactis]NUL03592.1 phage portal protein [Streptomyces lunaelactis]